MVKQERDKQEWFAAMDEQIKWESAGDEAKPSHDNGESGFEKDELAEDEHKPDYYLRPLALAIEDFFCSTCTGLDDGLTGCEWDGKWNGCPEYWTCNCDFDKPCHEHLMKEEK